MVCLSPDAVTNYSAVVDAGSDSEDEGKLHIVEADGGQVDGTDCDSTLPEDEAHCSDEGESHVWVTELF